MNEKMKKSKDTELCERISKAINIEIRKNDFTDGFSEKMRIKYSTNGVMAYGYIPPIAPRVVTSCK
jgi:hypothetical protein